jgi:hypothetical protein
LIQKNNNKNENASLFGKRVIMNTSHYTAAKAVLEETWAHVTPTDKRIIVAVPQKQGYMTKG